MPILTLIASLLQALSTVARNPALDLGKDAGQIADLVDLIAGLVHRGDEAYTELSALKAEVEALVAAGTGPSEEQTAAWRARSDAAHAALQALKSPGG